jgi:hypothetical protein
MLISRAIGRHIRAGRLAGLLLAGCIAGCVAPPASPATPAGIGVSNGTTLAVTLVVNGTAVATVEPHSDDAIAAPDLPPLPWVVDVRSPSGRLLTSMVVHPGDVRATSLPSGGHDSQGVGIRVDLSCGRLDVWSGPPLLGPMPGPGLPGDCLP